MDEMQTWETAIAAADGAPPPEPSVITAPETEVADPTPAPEQAEGETATVETPTDPAAREAEAQADKPTEEKPDDDVQEGDTEEIKALPRGAARAWARRRDRDAKIFDKYLGTEPISTVAEDLFAKSPSRYSELTRDIIQATFGMSYEDVKSKLEAPPQEAQTQTDYPPNPDNYDPLTDETLDPIVKAQLAELKDLKEKFPQLETKITSIEQAEAARAEKARAEQVQTIENELYQSVMSVVPEAIKSYGLEPSEKDPPVIVGLKRLAIRHFVDNVEPTFGADQDNTKAVDRARDYAKRLERENAFREEDVLKVRARAATDKVKESDEVKAAFEAIRIITEYQAKQIASRGSTTPGAPASSASAPLNGQGQLTGNMDQMWDQQIAGARVA